MFGIQFKNIQQDPKTPAPKADQESQRRNNNSKSNQNPLLTRRFHTQQMGSYYIKERYDQSSHRNHMAISACSFRSSSSSSSSSTAGALPLTEEHVSNAWAGIKGFENVLSPFAPAANLWISSDTGTVPVFSILLSSCSCSSSASSSSNSDSSTVSPRGALVIACAISSPSACCSRSFSL